MMLFMHYIESEDSFEGVLMLLRVAYAIAMLDCNSKLVGRGGLLQFPIEQCVQDLDIFFTCCQ
jgi:hypothetical protein